LVDCVVRRFERVARLAFPLERGDARAHVDGGGEFQTESVVIRHDLGESVQRANLAPRLHGGLCFFAPRFGLRHALAQ
jgi:hypothetical protein